MKRILHAIILLFNLAPTFAQNNVGIGTTLPNARALLDLTATDKGLLIPRMTTTQRLAIAPLSAAENGLVVYDLNFNTFYYFDGSIWKPIDTNYWVLSGGNLYNSNPANVGVGTLVPTSQFHVLGSLRFEGLLPSVATDEVLIIDPSGNVFIRNLPANVWDGDNQSITFDAITGDLSLSNGGSVNLNSLVTTPPALTLTGTNLNIIGSAGAAVDLSPFLDNTDAQNASLVGNILSLSGDATPVDLSPFLDNTDAQTLAFNNTTNVLSITNGNTVIIPDDDQQTLAYNATTGALTISNGNTVNIIASDTDWVDAGASNIVYNQYDQIGVGTASPDPSAIVQVSSTTQGFMFPTMSAAQMNAIPAPAVGLTVYNATLNVHQFWNGTCWLNLGQTVCTDFTLSLSGAATGCILNNSGSSTQTTLTLTLNAYSPVPVFMGATSVPSGVSVSFSNNPISPTSSTVVTVTGSSAAVPGVYNMNFISLYGTTTQTVPYTLTVIGSLITLSQDTGVVNEIGLPGNTLTTSTLINVAFTGTCGGAPNAVLILGGTLPVGVSYTFSVNPIGLATGVGSSVLTFTATDCAVVGYYPLTISVDLGGAILTFPYVLHVDTSYLPIIANTPFFDLYAALGGALSCPITLLIDVLPGVIIASNTTASEAFTTGGFPSFSAALTDEKYIIRLGCGSMIVGKGGQGGYSENSNALTTCANKNGFQGGPAIEITTDGVVIDNSLGCGFVGSGGGGGGSGGDNFYFVTGITLPGYNAGGSGGGGAGAGLAGATPPGLGGCISNGTNATIVPVAAAAGVGGSNATSTCDGAWSGIGVISSFPFFGTVNFSYGVGAGGNGGQYGQAGNNGAAAVNASPNAAAFGNSVSEGIIGCDEGNGGQPGYVVIANGHVFNYISTIGASTLCSACTAIVGDPAGIAGPVLP